MTFKDASYSLGALICGFGMFRPPKLAGRENRSPLQIADSKSTGYCWDKLQSNNIFERLKCVSNIGDRLHEISPFAGETMCWSSIGFLWVCGCNGSQLSIP